MRHQLEDEGAGADLDTDKVARLSVRRSAGPQVRRFVEQRAHASWLRLTRVGPLVFYLVALSAIPADRPIEFLATPLTSQPQNR